MVEWRAWEGAGARGKGAALAPALPSPARRPPGAISRALQFCTTPPPPLAVYANGSAGPLHALMPST